MNDILFMSIWMFFVSYFAVSTILSTNTPFHLNKVYMALQMVGYMLILSFLMSRQYYFLLGSIIITIIITYLLKYQILISEKEFLNGMIEHHQMALLMASKIIEKPISKFTRTLANNIIQNQKTEIYEMKKFLE